MTTWADLFRPGDATDFFDPAPAEPFRFDSDRYEPVNARWLMELCRLVYREKDRERFLDRADLKELEFIESERRGPDTQGYLVGARSGQWAALVFRGTSSPMDVWIDALARLVPWSEGGR